MKNEKTRLTELVNYLKEAKEKTWAIDMGDLMQRYNLTMEQVRDAVGKVFNP